MNLPLEVRERLARMGCVFDGNLVIYKGKPLAQEDIDYACTKPGGQSEPYDAWCEEQDLLGSGGCWGWCV